MNNNKVKKGLMSAIVLSSLLMVGCQKTVETGQGEDIIKQEEVVSALVIPKPVMLEAEDERFDVGEIQDRLDEINEGERLKGYKKQNDSEQILEVPKGFKTNNGVYTLINPEVLKEGTHLVYVGRDGCPYCQLLRVHLDPIVEQLGIEMDYVDIDEEGYGEIMVEEFGLGSVPNIQVIHEGEVVAEFPQSGMYLEEGADYESLSNGIGDMINIYLSNKHGIDLE